MIRDLLRSLRRVDMRRVAAVLALLAVAVVVLAGAFHATDGAGHDGSHGCSLCFATVTKAGAMLPAPTLFLSAPDTVQVTVRPSAAPVAVGDAVRLPEPRGPPAAA